MARLRLREGWITFLLLAAVVLNVTWAIQASDWADGWARNAAILPSITLAGLVVGLALAKWRRLPPFLAHPLALLIGGALIVARLDPLLPLARDGHGWQPAFAFLVARARAFWVAAMGTEPHNEDFYLFLLGLTAIVWLMAYGSAWMLFRARWIWPALLLPAVVLLLNLGYAPRNVSSSYLVFFLICAVLLVARFQIAEREAMWRSEGVAYPESLAARALGVGVVVATLVVGFAWGAPFAARSAPLAAAWERVNGPWQGVENRFNRLFGSLRGSSPRGIGNYATFADRFRLGGPLKLSQDPILVLDADRPFYLKVRTYDLFDGHQWDSTVERTFNPVVNGSSYAPQVQLAAGTDLTAPDLAALERHELRVRMLAGRGNSLFSADQFVNISQDTYVSLSWTQFQNRSFDVATTRPEDLPPDLRRMLNLLQRPGGPLRETDAAGNLRPVPRPTPSVTPTRGTPGTTGTPRNLTPAPPVLAVPPQSQFPAERPIEAETNKLRAQLIGVRVVVQGGVPVRMIVNGQVPNYGDVEVLLPRESVGPGAEYTTTILSSTAVAPQLREAGGDYPGWVTERYLQLPETTTDRTRALAAELAADKSPYDAAIAIQNWLRDNIEYKEDITFPPEDRDAVDYFLFDTRAGYCEYYSSAMAMMLRSVGIPAREAVGLFSGEYDEEQGGYLYRESNAHAWVEAYFPGYGWIAFEPTSPRQPFDREPAPSPADGAPADPGPGGDPSAGDNPDFGGFDDPAGGFAGVAGRGRQQAPPHPAVRVLRVAVPVGVLISSLLALLWLWGLRGLSPSGQFYARLTRSGALAGVRPGPGATPYEWSRAVGARVPDARRSLDQITALYVRERYGGRRATTEELRLVRRAWLNIRGLLLRASLSLRGRRRGGEG